jgi:hypothetical protein
MLDGSKQQPQQLAGWYSFARARTNSMLAIPVPCRIDTKVTYVEPNPPFFVEVMDYSLSNLV